MADAARYQAARQAIEEAQDRLRAVNVELGAEGREAWSMVKAIARLDTALNDVDRAEAARAKA